MELEEPEEQQQSEEQNIAIYSKWAIMGFSVLCSPLIGGILLMLNLWSINYKKQGILTLLSVIVYYFFSSIIVVNFAKAIGIQANDPHLYLNPQVIILMLILNIVGGAVLTEYIFKKYLSNGSYERKSIWRPLITMFLIVVLIQLLFR